MIPEGQKVTDGSLKSEVQSLWGEQAIWMMNSLFITPWRTVSQKSSQPGAANTILAPLHASMFGGKLAD